MNTTFKTSDYTKAQQLLKSAKNMKQKAKDSELWNVYNDAEKMIKKVEAIISSFPTVCVSYCIGYRSYYQEVIKIGKSYYLHGRRMTKSRGYRSIEEIPEITDKMSESMLADSYYY
jgi:hypothetical protein